MTLLDLLFVNREVLVGHGKVGGHLGQSDHKVVEFSISSEGRRGLNKTTSLDVWRADFVLFRRLVGGIPWEVVLKDKRRLDVPQEGSLQGRGTKQSPFIRK